MNPNKFIVIILAVMFSFTVSSCDKNDSLLVNPEVESSVEPNRNSVPLDDVYPIDISATRAKGRAWHNRKSGKGVTLWQRGDEKLFVVVLHLTKGAKFGMVFAPPVSGTGTEHAVFWKKSLIDWYNYGNQTNDPFFAVANSLYFCSLKGTKTELPFPFKQGIVYSKGQGGADKDKRFYKVLLAVDDNSKQAFVVNIGKNPMSYSYLNNNSVKKAYAGFISSHGNNEDDESKGRTFVGIRDVDKDGKYETIMLLVADAMTHAAARDVLEKNFLCDLDHIVTFDGSASSQLICPSYSSDYLVGKNNRDIPAVFVVKEGK